MTIIKQKSGRVSSSLWIIIANYLLHCQLKLYLCCYMNMCENIFEYIKILLPKHKCVTIPGFGAFILNKENYVPYAKGITVPRCSVVFNSRLQHDDGVLTSYIQSVQNISYEKAGKELANAIRKIRNILLLKKTVDCSSLGKIELTDGNIIFIPSLQYVFPQHYGLTPVGLNTLTAINRNIDKEVKVVSLKKKLAAAAAAAAVVLLLTVPSISITDSAMENSQQAGYLKSLITPQKVVVAKTENNSNAALPPIEEINMASTSPDKVINTANNNTISAINKTTSGRIYYLIIGGEPTNDRAQKALKKFKEEGFADAQIISSSERFRIYVASFSDKREAEQYLTRFRNENPKYESAWIHSQRNR